MKNIDVFNGDADGLCAVHQYRMVYPAPALAITGTKRDTALLERAQIEPHDEICVFDISLDVNRAALQHALNLDARVLWFDHHYSGPAPRHANLSAVIHNEPDTCTSALVDRYLGGQHRAWAVVAAYGDGLGQLAQRLAEPLRLTPEQLSELQALGECLNYNAYGDNLAELLVDPARLLALMQPYSDALRFAREEPMLKQIAQGRAADMERARATAPQVTNNGASVYVLPDEAWSRRVRGDFAHLLARSEPERAHAVLTVNAQGGYTVSVRAPQARALGADTFCRSFEGGGGRSAAAGINHLPAPALREFSARFFASFSA